MTNIECDETGCEDHTNANNLYQWTVITVEHKDETMTVHLCPTCSVKALSRRATALKVEKA
jgi:hypothetical protein